MESNMARADATEISTDDLTKQISALKKDLVELTNMMGTMGKEKAHNFASAARETGEAQYAKVQHGTQEAVRRADDFVTQQPLLSIGIAAGAGLLIGLVASRR